MQYTFEPTNIIDGHVINKHIDLPLSIPTGAFGGEIPQFWDVHVINRRVIRVELCQRFNGEPLYRVDITELFDSSAMFTILQDLLCLYDEDNA